MECTILLVAKHLIDFSFKRKQHATLPEHLHDRKLDSRNVANAVANAGVRISCDDEWNWPTHN